jgi:hypothetical protein
VIKFKYGDKVISTPEFNKEFKKKIEGVVERNVIIDEDGAVVKIKKTDGKYETFDQNWLMIDPCTTCALGLEGACIPAGEYYATSENKETEKTNLD